MSVRFMGKQIDDDQLKETLTQNPNHAGSVGVTDNGALNPVQGTITRAELPSTNGKNGKIDTLTLPAHDVDDHHVLAVLVLVLLSGLIANLNEDERRALENADMVEDYYCRPASFLNWAVTFLMEHFAVDGQPAISAGEVLRKVQELLARFPTLQRYQTSAYIAYTSDSDEDYYAQFVLQWTEESDGDNSDREEDETDEESDGDNSDPEGYETGDGHVIGGRAQSPPPAHDEPVHVQCTYCASSPSDVLTWNPECIECVKRTAQHAVALLAEQATR
jgi:hypothetical protein